MAREPGNPERFLREYSHGKVLSSREISALPIAWGTVPAFQRKVLKATAGIPYGRTATYGEIAAEVGSPGAARAVGAALSRNPWPILVPCHRVLGKGGRLVGFGKG
ncbi:MAG: MGMT family protein, partial [Deltaproteobacteria bacterium]|nr:MGMT family protein [Deltaproteobacteria bacterium]